MNTLSKPDFEMEDRIIVNHITLYIDKVKRQKIMDAMQAENRKYMTNKQGKLEEKYMKKRIKGMCNRRSVTCVTKAYMEF